MTRLPTGLFCLLLMATAAGVGCSSSGDDGGGSPGTGGIPATGGSSSTGGQPATGGQPGTGGVRATGGTGAGGTGLGTGGDRKSVV